MNESADRQDSHYRTARHKINIIVEDVARRRDVGVNEIMGRRRGAEICAARNEAMHIVRQQMKLSTPHIGRIFDRDHSTVIHALRNHAETLKGERR